MKIIHTADWHLGKSLKNQSLTDDQSYILQEFLKLVDDEKPDAIIIAGDIYDRAIPPVDAVNLFDEVIFKIVEKKIPVLSISGNHDSAGRLNFGSRLFERSKFFIETLPNENPKTVILEDKFGEVYLLLTATENEDFTKEGAIKACQGWVDCFDNVELKDTLFVGDVTDPNDILNNPLLDKAYELGKNIK